MRHVLTWSPCGPWQDSIANGVDLAPAGGYVGGQTEEDDETPARLRRRARRGRPPGASALLARLEKRLGRRLRKQQRGPRPRHVRHGDKYHIPRTSRAGPERHPRAEVKARLQQIEERNGQFFDEEVVKLDRGSNGLKTGLEREIEDLDKQIREARRVAAPAATLREKLEAQKAIKPLEGTRNKKRRELFDAQDAIDQQRDGLIGKIESQMRQRHTVTRLFGIRWGLK